jgi:hypothetical protein
MIDPAPKKRVSTPKRRKPPMAKDVDLTGGFRLDLKTMILIAVMLGSWYSQGSKTDAISQRLDLQDKARAQVEAANRETEKVREDAVSQQTRVLADSLHTLEQQLKLTSMDVNDLKILTAKRGTS